MGRGLSKKQRFRGGARAGNVAVAAAEGPPRGDDVAATAPPPEARERGRMQVVLDAADEGIREAAAAAARGGLAPGEHVVVVVDGTSPLAPPAVRKDGARGYGVRLARRGLLADALREALPEAAAQLDAPLACGHLACLASTADGALLLCTACDLGAGPGDAAGLPS